LIERVREFWEKHPVAAAAIPYRIGTPEYFRAYDRLREENESPSFSAQLHEYASFPQQKVLDVGCGNGYVLSRYAAAGAAVYGVDLTRTAVELSRARFALAGLRGQFAVGNAEHLPYPRGTFACICSMGVLHHLPDIGKAIAEIHRVLRPGGRFILMLYHRNSALYRVGMAARRWRTGRSLDEMVREVDGSGNPKGNVYSRADMRRLLADFADVECFAGLFRPDMVPKIGRYVPAYWWASLERRCGWFLYAKARKR
jgi:SAM-dependent methyltransferase